MQAGWQNTEIDSDTDSHSQPEAILESISLKCMFLACERKPGENTYTHREKTQSPHTEVCQPVEDHTVKLKDVFINLFTVLKSRNDYLTCPGWTLITELQLLVLVIWTSLLPEHLEFI